MTVWVLLFVGLVTNPPQVQVVRAADVFDSEKKCEEVRALVEPEVKGKFQSMQLECIKREVN